MRAGRLLRRTSSIRRRSKSSSACPTDPTNFKNPGIERRCAYVDAMAKWPPFGPPQRFQPARAALAGCRNGPRIVLNATATDFLIRGAACNALRARRTGRLADSASRPPLSCAAGAIEKRVPSAAVSAESVVLRDPKTCSGATSDHLSVKIGILDPIGPSFPATVYSASVSNRMERCAN